jgi:hypothetical protein
VTAIDGPADDDAELEVEDGGYFDRDIRWVRSN